MMDRNVIGKFSKLVMAGMLMLPPFLFTNVGTSEVSAESIASSEQYVDVTPDFWGYQTIQWGFEKHIISGYPDHTMRPDQPITESEFLAMLLRYYSNTKNSNRETPFKNWAEPYYQTAADFNWTVSGSSAAKPILRGQVAQLLADSQGYQYDIDNSIQFLLNVGLAKGRNGYTLEGFEKDSPLTRVV